MTSEKDPHIEALREDPGVIAASEDSIVLRAAGAKTPEEYVESVVEGAYADARARDEQDAKRRAALPPRPDPTPPSPLVAKFREMIDGGTS